MGKKAVSSSKQADRKAKKAEAKAEDAATERPQVESGSFVELAQALVMGSVAAEHLPRDLPSFVDNVKEAIQEVKEGKKAPPKNVEKEAPKEEEKEDDGEKTEEKADAPEDDAANGNGDADKKAKHSPGSPEAIFASLQQRLAWHNSLGLATPFSGDESMKAWKSMLALEFDGGPRAKRKGNPGIDRVVANATKYMPQYIHLLMALMTLRAFVFRSFFACLPWLLLYQFGSVFLPLDKFAPFPALPLDKVDVKFRVAITVTLNALVWLFFAYEALWKVWWLEKFFWVGILSIHAYVVRAVE